MHADVCALMVACLGDELGEQRECGVLCMRVSMGVEWYQERRH